MVVLHLRAEQVHCTLISFALIWGEQPAVFVLNHAVPAAQVHRRRIARGFLADSMRSEVLLCPYDQTIVIERVEGILFPGKPDSPGGAFRGREARP
jgi:hypothetical protein